MHLTRTQFTALIPFAAAADGLSYAPAPASLSDVAADLSSLATGLKECEQLGLIADGHLTERGAKAMAPHRVKNAVIMAAGLSSRLAPLSYECPKGIIPINGEGMVERQVRQLREAGVTDITIVVGYQRHQYEELAKRLGVAVIVNDHYADRNNSWSVWLARELLGNTYLCSSDNYFATNPFEPYVWRSYYSAVWAEGPTDEWCIKEDDSGLICDVSIGGSDAWVMLGHVYMDTAYAKQLVACLAESFTNEENYALLWESIFLANLQKLPMEVRHYPDGVIHEFDSLTDVLAFDPTFMETVPSAILDNIAATLGCPRSEPRDFKPLTEGLTNYSCRFSTNSGQWVYRHPGQSSNDLVNRQAEAEALRAARDLGIDKTFVHSNPQEGWKISSYISNSHHPDPHNPEHIARMFEIARRLHTSGASISQEFSYLTEGLRYRKLLAERDQNKVDDVAELTELAQKVAKKIKLGESGYVLCHNDFFPANFLIDEQGQYHLIDWEYAGMGDYANDFGTFVVCCELNTSEALAALDSYFGREATHEEALHALGIAGLAGWCWTLWALIKEADGADIGNWRSVYQSYAEKYLKPVLENTDFRSSCVTR